MLRKVGSTNYPKPNRNGSRTDYSWPIGKADGFADWPTGGGGPTIWPTPGPDNT